ncbi:MAG TPA: hypothetical protein PKW28_05405 [Turneriella sp.]|nr:hypothetical protein [Turneriella sp.]HNE18378.1 hypothetical protein [Turneriella sp.]HNJ65311.1 hypothetical protein [Turneriella sp.]HNL54939.1 hypothetical protein [Turneriella sp.]
MISKTLSDIGNVSIYPVVTLVIFFSIFTLMLIMVLRGNKSQYAKMAALPLEEGQGEAPQRSRQEQASVPAASSIPRVS